MSLIPGQGSVLTGWCCCQAGQEKANWTLGCAQSLPGSNTATLLCQEHQTSPRTAPGSLWSWKSYLMRLHHFKECVEVFRGKKYGLFLLFERRWQANLLFSVLQQSPQTKLKSILLCTGAISTQNNNQVSIWLPAEKNIKLHITAIYIRWNYSCCLLVSGCVIATMNPTSRQCHPLPVCPKWHSKAYVWIAAVTGTSWLKGSLFTGAVTMPLKGRRDFPLISTCTAKRNCGIKVSDPKCCQRSWEDTK